MKRKNDNYYDRENGWKSAGEDWMYEEYNGHPTWFHWNVLLWIGNNENDYRAVMDLSRNEFISDYLASTASRTRWTKDGAIMDEETLGYAWDCLHEILPMAAMLL